MFLRHPPQIQGTIGSSALVCLVLFVGAGFALDALPASNATTNATISQNATTSPNITTLSLNGTNSTTQFSNDSNSTTTPSVLTYLDGNFTIPLSYNGSTLNTTTQASNETSGNFTTAAPIRSLVSDNNGTSSSSNAPRVTVLASLGGAATTPVPVVKDDDVNKTDPESKKYFIAILIIVIFCFVFIFVVLIAVVVTRKSGGSENRSENYPMQEGGASGSVSGHASGYPARDAYAQPVQQKDNATNTSFPMFPPTTTTSPQAPERKSYVSNNVEYPRSPPLQPPPTAIRQEFPLVSMGDDLSQRNADEDLEVESSSSSSGDRASVRRRDEVRVHSRSANYVGSADV